MPKPGVQGQKNESEKSGSRGHRYWYLLLLIPFLVYLKGLAPSVVFGDSGDYLTAGWIMGASHPPGYPLFTMLVGLFERLPIPAMWVESDSFSIQAWRGNFLSMLFGVSTLGVLFALVNRVTGNRIAALAASGALAFSWVFWWHSEICENDTMSTFLLVSMLLLAVRYTQEKRPSDPYLLAFVIGTGVAHHHVLIIFALPVIIYLLVAKSFDFSFSKLVLLFLIALIGLFPIFYLPLTNYKVPENNLVFTDGGPVDYEPDTIYTSKSRGEYFWDYVLRKVYSRQRQYTHSDEALGEDFTTTHDVDLFYTLLVPEDFGPVLPIFGLAGIAWGIIALLKRLTSGKKDKYPTELNSWGLIFIGWFVYFLLIHFFPSGDILRAPRYNLDTAGPGLMLPLEVMFAIFIGLGAGAMFKWLKFKFPSNNIYSTALTIVLILLVILNAAGNYNRSDKSHHTIAHEYALNVMDSCPEDSILLTAGDEMYVFRYMHYVHEDPNLGTPGYRPDLKIVPWSGMLASLSELADISNAMVRALETLIEDYPGTEIDTTFMNSEFLESPTINSRTLARRGVVFSFVPDLDDERLSGVNPGLTDQTGVDYYQPGLPDSYLWTFWDSSRNLSLIESSDLWPPEGECRWRIAETLLFYGSQELVSMNNPEARGYFERLVAIEPWSEEAKKYLSYATSEDGQQ